MPDSSKRLQRLAAAQAELVRILELRVSMEAARLIELRHAHKEAVLAADRVASEGMSNYSVTLRRLVRMSNAISVSEQRLSDFSRELIKAKGRCEAISDRAAVLASLEHRKGMEVQMQETVIAMETNAPRKGGVLVCLQLRSDGNGG